MKSQLDQILAIIKALQNLDATAASAEQFPTWVVSALREHLDLQACTFYSYHDKSQILSLRAQSGFSYSDYKSFQLSLNSTAGRAVKKQSTVIVRLVQKPKDYRDKNLIDKYGLKSMAVVPIGAIREANTSDVQKQNGVLGVICLYAEPHSRLERIAATVEKLTSIIGASYESAVDHDKLRLRQQVLDSAIAANDLRSFFHRIGILLSKDWRYGAVSIFLYNSRSNTLRLQSTTGLVEELRKENVFFRLTDSCETVKAFRDGGQRLIAEPGKETVIKEHLDAVDLPRLAVLLLPIFEPKAIRSKEQRTIGVLRVTNRTIEHDNIREPAYFGWEDLQLLEFVSSISSAVAHMFSRQPQSMEDLERAVHGFQSHIQFIRSSLNQLLERPNVFVLHDVRYAYIIPDCIAHIESLFWQLERFGAVATIQTIKIRKTLLFGDVLTKLPPTLIALGKAFNTHIRTTRIFEESSAEMRQLSPIAADADALLTVFRNLIENSVKYSKLGEPVSIDLSISETKENVAVHFSDYGIGIEEKDINYIFREGYRAENAIHRSVRGSGFGLSQCVEILQAMGGDIKLANARNPTTFRITLRKWGELDLFHR